MNKKIAMLLLGLGCTYAFAANPTPTPTDPDPAACDYKCAVGFRTCTAAGLPVAYCNTRVQGCVAACHPGQL